MRLFRRSSKMLLSVAVAVAGMSLLASDSAPQTLFENDRVRISRLELPKDATLPENSPYDTVTVQLGPGETKFLEPGHLEKNEPGGTGQTHYFVARTKRLIRNDGKAPVPFIEVQFVSSPGKYSVLDVPATHYCNPGSKKACVTERYQFCTDKFCAESVTLDPGAVSTQHTHDADHIVIPTSDFTWREEASGKAPVDYKFKPGDVKYVPAGVTHRLTNVGTTTAKLFVIQFK